MALTARAAPEHEPRELSEPAARRLAAELSEVLDRFAPGWRYHEPTPLPHVVGSLRLSVSIDATLTYWTPYHTEDDQGPNRCTAFASFEVAASLCLYLLRGLPEQPSAPGAQQGETQHDGTGQ